MLTSNKLHSLGLCLAFDLIINNGDRFRLLWRGEGNIENVLIEVDNYSSHHSHHIKDRSNTII
jgi:hypothetical protein